MRRNPGVVLKQRNNGDSLVFGLYYVTHPDQIHNFIAGSTKKNVLGSDAIYEIVLQFLNFAKGLLGNYKIVSAP